MFLTKMGLSPKCPLEGPIVIYLPSRWPCLNTKGPF